jgi:hypothetical protein
MEIIALFRADAEERRIVHAPKYAVYTGASFQYLLC